MSDEPYRTMKDIYILKNNECKIIHKTCPDGRDCRLCNVPVIVELIQMRNSLASIDAAASK